MAVRNVACIGGGPAGLYTAILLRLRMPDCRVTVYERNPRDATFGFGVVFSDETLDNIAAADEVSYTRIEREFRYWSDLEIRKPSATTRSSGHGFAAFPRLRLLQVLADRALELGAEVHFDTEVEDPAKLDADLLVCADGANSALRRERDDDLGVHVNPGTAHFAWFGTEHDFKQFTFIFEQTDHGIVQAHCYPYADDASTFIVELADDTWRALGLAPAGRFAPGETDERARSFTEDLFGRHLGGHGLIGNNSQWLQFPEVTAQRWHAGRRVYLGDAIHTAHFSVGSGTKLALEDAIALVDELATHDDLDAALAAYQEVREPQVASTQRAARTSQQWFEHVDRYWALDAPQFDFQLLTRSQRINLDNLVERDPALATDLVDWWRARQPLAAADGAPPMFVPFQLRDVVIPNRVGVSPMAQYCAVDGLPNTWHLVHLGSRAVGGAGLVMVEMTCVSPEGRITPGCTGLYTDEQAEAFRPIVEFVHDNTDAVVGMQIGHSGRKGGMYVPWEVDGDDAVPLDEPWDRMGPSPVPFRPDGPVPRPMTPADMARVVDEHVAAARRARDLGFDLLEIHMAHGYLLSSFLSPLTNRRPDRWGGDLDGRLRFPSEVVEAVRATWPEHLPLSVRISATDWAEGGTTGDDAVVIARRFGALGVDVLDVSTGQVVDHQQPRYGRLYQTPYSDRIRLETGMPTMTVGSVTSVDDVNTVLVAGRADLCLMARPHLVDPYWTLNAAMDQGFEDHPWPPQYLSGHNARRRDQDPDDRLRAPRQRTSRGRLSDSARVAQPGSPTEYVQG